MKRGLGSANLVRRLGSLFAEASLERKPYALVPTLVPDSQKKHLNEAHQEDKRLSGSPRFWRNFSVLWCAGEVGSRTFNHRVPGSSPGRLTLKIRAGYEFNVMVTRDLVLAGPYKGREEPGDETQTQGNGTSACAVAARTARPSRCSIDTCPSWLR